MLRMLMAMIRRTTWVSRGFSSCGNAFSLLRSRPCPAGVYASQDLPMHAAVRSFCTRSAWMRRRSLHDVWFTAQWIRKCFRGWRTWVAICGPAAWQAWREAREEGGVGEEMCELLADARGDPLAEAEVLATTPAQLTLVAGQWRVAACFGRLRPKRVTPLSHGAATRPCALMLLLLRAAGAVGEAQTGVATVGERADRAQVVSVASAAARLAARQEAIAQARRMAVLTAKTFVKTKFERKRQQVTDDAHEDGMLRTAAKRRRAVSIAAAASFRAGQTAGGRDTWAVRHVVALRMHGRAHWFLVRWEGGHEDSWLPYTMLNVTSQAAARRFYYITTGSKWRHTPAKDVQLSGEFRRLKRGRDVGSSRSGPSARDGAEAARAPGRRRTTGVDDGWDHERRPRVAVDDTEELSTRGEQWREFRAAVTAHAARATAPLST